MIRVYDSGDESVVDKIAQWTAGAGYKRILDIGGAEKPLRCATHVMDLVPYYGRRVDVGRGDLPERFTEETWLVYDINTLPWPFPDGYFDFTWASQILEDIRDPVAVCMELMRVSSRGYIGTVDRSYESSAQQADGVIGYHHHRWLIEADPALKTVWFEWKSPMLHVRPDLRPPSANRWLLHIEWEGPFIPAERWVGGDQGQERALRDYLGRWASERRALKEKGIIS